MAAKKYRPRNPWRTDPNSLDWVPSEMIKAVPDFTGQGDEWISGTKPTDAVLTFKNGIFAGSLRLELMKSHTYEDTAQKLRFRGEAGHLIDSSGYVSMARDIPADVQDLLSIPDVAILAARLIDAIHSGEPQVLRAIADIAANPRADELPGTHYFLKEGGEYRPFCWHLAFPDLTRDTKGRELILEAVDEAAREAGSVPTMEQAQDILSRIYFEASPKNFTKRFPNLDLESMKEKLNGVGFGWLPHRKQGEHLKRQAP